MSTDHERMIMYQLLERAGACTPCLSWFAERFPSGATWHDVVETCHHHGDGAEYAAWIAWWCPAGVEGATWAARLALQRDDVDRALFGQHCPAGVEGATYAARLALQRNDFDRARLGRHCPAGVAGATFAARLALQRNDYERALFGRYCPAGVEGDTWAARLELQRNDFDRARLGWYCPPGVEGVTWSARLALQRNDYDRALLASQADVVEGLAREREEAEGAAGLTDRSSTMADTATTEDDEDER